MGEKLDTPGMVEMMPVAEMWDTMQSIATAKAGEFEPKGVVQVLWALTTTGVRADRGLMEAMGRRALATAEEYKPQQLVEVLWALATLAMGDEILGVLRDRFAARVLEIRDELNGKLNGKQKCRIHQ